VRNTGGGSRSSISRLGHACGLKLRNVYNKKEGTGCVHVGRGAFTIQLVLSRERAITLVGCATFGVCYVVSWWINGDEIPEGRGGHVSDTGGGLEIERLEIGARLRDETEARFGIYKILFRFWAFVHESILFTILCAPTFCLGTPPHPVIAHTIVQSNFLPRPPVTAIYTTHYWQWQYHAKAKARYRWGGVDT